MHHDDDDVNIYSILRKHTADRLGKIARIVKIRYHDGDARSSPMQVKASSAGRRWMSNDHHDTNIPPIGINCAFLMWILRKPL